MGFHHVGHNSLDLLTSSNLPASASQSVGITGISHCTQLRGAFIEPQNDKIRMDPSMILIFYSPFIDRNIEDEVEII